VQRGRSAPAGSSTSPPTVSVEAKPAMMPPTNWAMDEARNQTAIMKLTTAGIDSLVISDRPTGDRNSSPVVCSI
jgi:hypothetical protein